MNALILSLISAARAACRSQAASALENLALRQQLTIYHMIARNHGPRKTQTWRTFIKNHANQVRACDFLTQHTAFFTVAYVFVIMEVDSRRIVHANVTRNPTLTWVKQQIREATAWDRAPHLLVHDNDGIFGQFGRPVASETGHLVALPVLGGLIHDYRLAA